MPQQVLPAAATGLPKLDRRAVEAQIDLLIELLDRLDDDPDLEPALGWTEYAEWAEQDQPEFVANENAGDDRELDDEREPDVDGELSLGWRNEGPQTGDWYPTVSAADLEGGSPEWPAESAKPQCPTGRRMPEPVTVSMAVCRRIAA